MPLGSVLGALSQADFGNVTLFNTPPLLSGYSDLDSLLGGMQRSDLLVWVQGQAWGKSSLALNISVSAAKAGQVCGIFSLEMSREQVAMRILVAESGVDSHRLRLGLLSEQEENIIANVVGALSGLPIYIDDTSSQTAMEMHSEAERLKLEHGLDFLVVDYLQLMRGQGIWRGYGENRVTGNRQDCSHIEGDGTESRSFSVRMFAVEPRGGKPFRSSPSIV